MKIPELLAQARVDVTPLPYTDPSAAAQGGVTRAGAVIGGRVEGAGRIDAGGPTRQAFGQIGQTLQKIGEREALVQAEMVRYQRKLEAATLLSQGAQQLDEAVLTTINNPGLEATTFVPHIEGRYTAIRQSLLEKASSDEVRVELGMNLDKLYGPQRHKVMAHSFDFFHSSVRAQVEDALQTNAKLAASEPNGTLARFYDEASEILVKSQIGGAYTPEQARKTLEGYRGELTNAEAERLIRDDPETFVARGVELFGGRMDPARFEAKLTRATSRWESLKRDAQEKRERREREHKERLDTERKALVIEYDNKAAARTLTLAELDVRLELGHIDRGTHARLTLEVKAPTKGLPSDEMLRSRVLLDSESMNPRHREEDIDEFHRRHLAGAPGLNLEDAIRAKQQLRTTRKALETEGEQQLRADHAQAEQELAAAAGINPGLLASRTGDDPAARIFSSTLTALRRRSRLYNKKDGEDPLRVADELIPRILSALDKAGTLKDRELRGLLGPYVDETRLDADRRANVLSEKAYRYYRDLRIQWQKPGL